MKRSIDKLIFAILVAVCFCLQACTEYETPAEIAVDKEEAAISSSDIQRKVLWINIDGAVGKEVESLVKGSLSQGAIAGMLTKSKYSWMGFSESRKLENEIEEDPVTWATMLTGVIPEKHHIVDNSYMAEFDVDPANPNEKVVYYPTILQYITTYDNKMETLCVTPWEKLNTGLLNYANKTHTTSGDEETREVVLNSLKEGDYTLTLLSFSGMLEAGKQGGFVASNTAYVAALGKIDGYISEFLDVIESRKNIYYEDWLVVVTSNHGGDAEGHYGNVEETTRNTLGIFYYSHYEPLEMKGESMYGALFSPEIQAVAYDTLAKYYGLGEDKEFSLEFVMRNTPRKDGSYKGNNWDRIIGKNGWGIYRKRETASARLEGGDGDKSTEEAVAAFNDALWHTYVLSIGKMNNGTRKFRVAYDGLVVLDKSIMTIGQKKDTTLLTIGGSGMPTSYYVSEIRMWNSVLDDATLAANANRLNISESDADYKNLTSYWKFNPDRISNDTIIQNNIQGMLDLNFIRKVDGKNSILPDENKRDRISLLSLPNTLSGKIKSGNIMMENTLVVPQILYWLKITVDSKIDGFTFLNNYSASEEWREKELEVSK